MFFRRGAHQAKASQSRMVSIDYETNGGTISEQPLIRMKDDLRQEAHPRGTKHLSAVFNEGKQLHDEVSYLVSPKGEWMAF